MQYNPLTNDFVVYEPIEDPKVEINMELFDNPIDVSNWSSSISNEGIPIVKSSFNPVIVNNNSEQTKYSNQDIDNSNLTTSVNLSGRKKQAMDFFKSKGLSDIHSAGIVANLLGESELNHTAVNPKSKAYGLAQWLGSRKTKLFNKYGKNPSFEQQLEFVWDELNTSEKNAFNLLLQTKSYQKATDSFMRNFERPSDLEMAQSIGKRLNFAKGLLNG